MTRFDIPATVKTILSAVIEEDIADAADVFALGGTYGDDFDAMVDEVVSWAFARRHDQSDIHAKIANLADAYHAAKIAA